MDNIAVEITVHRVGGPDQSESSPLGTSYPWERTYGPWNHNVWVQQGYQLFDIQGAHVAPDRMTVRFYSFQQSEHDGWYSGELHLSDVNGRPIGSPRAFLHYGRPSDVAMHTHCYSPHFGHYVVALRCPSSRPDGSDPTLEPCAEGCRVCRPDLFTDGEQA